MSTERNTLDSIVDEYLLQRQIDKKKYYASYLNMAKYVWKHLFQKTIYSVQSEWQPLRKGEPHDYIDLPKDMVRLFTIAEVNECGNIVPLFYNSEMNVISKPKVNTCGCTACNCMSDGLCEDFGTLIKSSRLLFTINNVNYYEYSWIELCKNGDIIEYREVPTKKYNDFVGDGGDYNTDYNNDYLIANPSFSDYSVVTEKFQKIICHVDVKPCGCPKNTPENEEIILTNCSQYFCYGARKKKHCEALIGDTNSNGRGMVKVSECGTKAYYKPDPHKHRHKLPEYLLVNFQTSGTNCSSAVVVPEYAIEAMMTGIDYYSVRFNAGVRPAIIEFKKYAWVSQQNDLIMYLNPFNLEELANVQDQVVKF